MPLRPSQRLQYLVERLLVRGAHYRLLFAAAIVGLVSVGAGTLVMRVDGGFDEWSDAVWWAFLRLTDPGYLGDDVGVARRVISFSVTVMGYVVFLGSLVAIMTQWLTQTLRNLERGFTPVVRHDHILVLGWTNRTPSILQELLQSHGRAGRFLRRVGARRLVIVVLADDVNAERVQSLKDSLGPLWDPGDLILRSGSALQVDHLERVAFAQAAAVILPGSDFSSGGLDNSDSRIIKTILTISHYGRQQRIDHLPWLVGEIFDDRKLHLARRAYAGEIEILSSHRFVARLMAQVVRHVGVFPVFEELLIRDDGNEVFIRPCKEFVGRSFAELVEAYPQAVLLGFVQPSGASFKPLLNPADDTLVDENTRAVLLARTFEDTQPLVDTDLQALPREQGDGSQDPDLSRRRILVLGWNHKASDFLRELDSYTNERFDVHVLSVQPAADRHKDV
ncbi:MAG: ion channel DMI1, partial [Gemmatimonadaceae bacterium]|nr:ion channel DMI1 [Gemmatimonadaceae bacterium]